MAVIENDVIKVTVSSSSTRNVIRVSPGVSALSSVSLSLNELNDVDTTGITNGQTIVYENGSFVAGDAGAVKTINNEAPDADGNVNVSINDLTDVKITNAPAEGDALIFSNNFWTTGDAGASVLNDLTDVNVPSPSTGAILKYNGSQWTAQALSIPSVPATYYHQRYATDAQTFLTGATETVELYYTARADGDGLHESAQSDTPTAGYDIQRKLYYSEKAKANPDTSADWTQFTAIADNTSYNDAKTALLAYLNERTGGTSPISLKITWEEVVQAPSFTGLLNEAYGGGAEAAYSTRRLNGNYSGDCMVIRRASDGTTQSIGFVGEEIDESAIETFCTGTTCTVATWYDQSGNGNNATQSDSTKQPTIYTGGQLVKERGRLALDFDGLNDYLEFTQIDLTGDCLIAHIATHSSGDSAYGGPTGNFGAFQATTTELRWRFSGATYYATVPTITAGDQYLSLFRRESGTANMSYDGVDTTSQALSGTGSFSVLGASATNSGWLFGKAQEYIFYTSAKTSQNRTDIEGNISAYFQSAKLLDEQFGEGAEAAYSTRKLRRDQTDCMVIRRASDSTTTTIGFDANGNIDEAAIETFCTGTTCTVVTWKDQSGNGNDATASSTGAEPTIYTGGAVVKLNGKAALLGGQYTGFTLNSLIDYVQPNDKPSFFFHGMTTSATSYYTDSTSTRLYLLKTAPTYIAAQGFAITRNGTSSSVAVVNERELLSFISSQSTGYDVNRIFVKGSSNIQGYTGYYNEAILYKTDKSSVRTQIESNIGDYFTQNTPLLDTYSGAAAAYSLRKLNSSYTGAAIEVYAGTNGTADIGFNVFGELDTVALAAHCGSNDGTVQTWYDQSGNGNHATQGVAGSQPKIYDGATTSVVTENGKVAVEFDGSDDFLSTTTVIISGTIGRSMFAVANSDFSTTDAILTLSNHTPVGSGEAWVWTPEVGVRVVGSKLWASNPMTTQKLGSLHLAASSNVTDVDYYENGILATSTGQTAATINSIATGATEIGNYSVASGWNFKGTMQEIIVYGSDNSSNRANIEDNINTFYSIY